MKDIKIKNKEKRLATYGHEYLKVYSIWGGMKSRCFNKNAYAYEKYGGRGITVCDRWLDFNNFYEDMGSPPKGKTLDRIDNNGNYDPSNCRWATMIQQSNNRSSNLIIEFRGRKRTVAEWARILNIKRHIVYGRLKRGWCERRALSIPC